MPYSLIEQFKNHLTPSAIRVLSFILKVLECNQKSFSDVDPSTPLSNIVPIYSPTRDPSVLPSTFPSQKPISVPSLKPSTSPKLIQVKLLVHTFYNNININTEVRFQNSHSQKCIYHLLQH